MSTKLLSVGPLLHSIELGRTKSKLLLIYCSGSQRDVQAARDNFAIFFTMYR